MPEDKYKIKVEIDKSELEKFNQERKYMLQKDVDDHKTANRIKSADYEATVRKEVEALKMSNTVKVADLRKTSEAAAAQIKILEQKITAEYQLEVEAYKHSNQMKIKEAIATRKILEGEIKGYNAILRGEIRKEVEQFKTGEEQKRAEFKRTIAEIRKAPKVTFRGDIGSEAYVRQLQSIQTKMLPGSEEFVQTNALINRYKDNLKAAGVHVQSLAEKTSSLNFENIKLAAGYLGVTAGLSALISYSVRATQVWAQQETAARTLEFAVTKVTGQNKSLTQSLQEYSNITQAKYRIDNAVIKQQEAFLVLQGRSEDQIKKIIQAAIELSAVQNDLSNENVIANVKKLDQTYEGTVLELGRYDERLKLLTPEQLRNGDAVKLLGDKYKGTADEINKGTTGTLKSVGLAWDKFTEGFGKGITATLFGLNQMDDGVSDSAIKMQELLKTAADVGEVMANLLTGKYMDEFLGWATGLDKAKEKMDAFRYSAQFTNITLKNMADDVSNAINTIQNRFNTFQSQQPGAYDVPLPEGYNRTLGKTWQQIQDENNKKLKTGTSSIQKEIDAVSELIKKSKDYVHNLELKKVLNSESLEIELKNVKSAYSESLEIEKQNELLEYQNELLKKIDEYKNRAIQYDKKGRSYSPEELASAPRDIAGTPGHNMRILPTPAEEDDFFAFMQEAIGLANQFGDAISGKLDDAGKKVLSIVQYMFSALASILSQLGKTGEVSPLSIFGSILGLIPFLAEEGGLLEGPSHALGGVPLVAEGGEYIVKKEKVTPHTLPFLMALNEDYGAVNLAKRYFDTGGYIYPDMISKRDKLMMGRHYGSTAGNTNLKILLAGDIGDTKLMNRVYEVTPGVNVEIEKYYSNTII